MQNTPLQATLAIPSVDGSSGLMLLPFVLSMIAGSTDVIGFLGLGGLLTAHITGNLVILVAKLVASDPVPLSYLIAVPVFVIVLGMTRLLVAVLEQLGIASLLPCCSCNSCSFAYLSPFASPLAHTLIQMTRARSLPVCWAFRRWPCRTCSCGSQSEEHRPLR
jgi:uncharacterized membrane protein YoaK (UPF0700 family)